MTDSPDIYFQISDSGNLIRLEPVQADNDWIHTIVTIKGGVFNGKFTADFMITEFELLKRDFRHLENNFTGIAKFEPLEGQLTLNITGDGLGHFEVDCIAYDQVSHGAKLSFSLTFDQTELKRLINELDQITKAFPIKSDFSF